jgi:hypothetical protein
MTGGAFGRGFSGFLIEKAYLFAGLAHFLHTTLKLFYTEYY